MRVYHWQIEHAANWNAALLLLGQGAEVSIYFLLILAFRYLLSEPCQSHSIIFFLKSENATVRMKDFLQISLFACSLLSPTCFFSYFYWIAQFQCYSTYTLVQRTSKILYVEMALKNAFPAFNLTIQGLIKQQKGS